jgi:hypothetical protein
MCSDANASSFGYCRYLLRLSRRNLYSATIATNVSLLGAVDPLAVILEPTDAAPPVIVVSNPGSVDSSGNVVRNLMVARPAVPLVSATSCPQPTPSAPLSRDAAATREPETFVDVSIDDDEDARLLPARQQQ